MLHCEFVFAFGAPTGGNAPCSNMFGTLSTISSHYKIKKQDSGNGQQCCQSTARRNKMGMHKVRIVSLSTKGVSKQDGIVEVPEETDCNRITSVNKTSLSR
ncbi:hypothetical protein T12_13650 [Trichinella patagoniensis]|uniref:Uncharacterized protein n=1 Tax=Trichinella patagoniensis TaxID=990121 RepID=A0A0V0ZYU4_9BILA|nr:hypothetical protein T12_13650 [Trichinella patagoniensis]